jgi:hypothetical protein
MIERKAISLIKQVTEQFPVVSIIGPRQCGKTTLAKVFLRGEYFDFEKPSDLQVFSGDAELALRRFGGPLILDEAQNLPELFPLLRSMIDQNRRQSGRYFLLGSVNPDLIKKISESLAGRVGMVELTPFLYEESIRVGIDLDKHWLRGGFPDACMEKTESRRLLWMENYMRTFIERDLPRLGRRISPVQMRRLMGMIAHHHAGILNSSDFGRSMGITYHTVNELLDLIEGHFLIRRLPPYHANLRKRLVKSPKLYLRDSGILHFLLGIPNERQLLQSPQRGNSWEGYLMEQIITKEQIERVGSQFYFYRTHAGAEIDLLIDRGHERIGFEFKCAVSANPKDWSNLQRGIEDKVIDRGFLVYMGEREFPAADKIEILNAASFLAR